MDKRGKVTRQGIKDDDSICFVNGKSKTPHHLQRDDNLLSDRSVLKRCSKIWTLNNSQIRVLYGIAKTLKVGSPKGLVGRMRCDIN